MTLVIDTNVLVVANGADDSARARCQLACIEALELARNGRVAIDDAQGILNEYRTYCSFRGQPGVGDAFFLWLWNHQGDPARCLTVAITPHDGRGFAEFPDDERLVGFDPNDRKFVAVCRVTGDASRVLNATDSDWLYARAALGDHGVQIEFLCPECMPKKNAKR